MPNRTEADCMDILRNGSETCMNILKVQGEKDGLTIAAFDQLSCFPLVENLNNITSSSGVSVWREDNPVHLTAAAWRHHGCCG